MQNHLYIPWYRQNSAGEIGFFVIFRPKSRRRSDSTWHLKSVLSPLPYGNPPVLRCCCRFVPKILITSTNFSLFLSNCPEYGIIPLNFPYNTYISGVPGVGSVGKDGIPVCEVPIITAVPCLLPPYCHDWTTNKHRTLLRYQLR